MATKFRLGYRMRKSCASFRMASIIIIYIQRYISSRSLIVIEDSAFEVSNGFVSMILILSMFYTAFSAGQP